METLLPKLLKDRGLIQALNSTIYEFSHEYELVIHDKEWTFTDAKGKGNIIVNLTDSEITFIFPDVTLEYKKKDRIVKTAVSPLKLRGAGRIGILLECGNRDGRRSALRDSV